MSEEGVDKNGNDQETRDLETNNYKKETNKFPLLAFEQVEQQEIEQGIHKKDSQSEKSTLLVKKTQWWTVMLVIQKLNLKRLTLFLVIIMPWAWIMQTMLRKRFLLLLVKCRKQSTRRLLKHLMKRIRERGTYEHRTKHKRFVSI